MNEGNLETNEITTYNAENVCPNCGAIVDGGQAFCPNCGQKIIEMPQKNNFRKIERKKLPLIFGIVGGGIVILCLIAAILLNPHFYVKLGNYDFAHTIAFGETKDDIFNENIIAVASADCAASLANPAAFELNDAWIKFDDEKATVVLEISGENAYGDRVTNYYYYEFKDNSSVGEENECTYQESYSDLEQEYVNLRTSYGWNISVEEHERNMKETYKIIDNMFKSKMTDAISNGVHISEDSVDNINNLFIKGALSNVALIKNKARSTK